jgi:hypothetical protein
LIPDLAEDIKEMLLPTVKELPQLITLDERRMGQLRNYLTAELASLKFCAENRDERMEL